MKFWQSLLVLILMAVPVSATEPIKKVPLPLEVKYELLTEEIPKEIEGKVWNRWTSENFTVLSLNDVQAQYLHKHLELVKTWIYARWGLYDLPFQGETKLICVDDPALFNKMFRLTHTKVEIRLDEQGKIKESVIYVLINDAPSHTVPIPLTEVCMAQFAQNYDAKIGWWAVRGMSLLNGTLDQIKTGLKDFGPIVHGNKPIYFSKGLFEMTKEQYNSLDVERKTLYDQSALVFCLMLRKEFGQDAFHWFLKKSSDSSPEVALQEILRFQGGYVQFDPTLKRYMLDLTRDIQTGTTPDSYLQIVEKH